ncbi:hypothetical protein C823_005417 [Eubacterium plexicaudatum ASF492]|uniref:Uncharacterized protein n=1 Tax=Eubacterium plexicaudatum ASF492 TaxID=1235802 RepID=N2B6C7_9FIRM|nr:hypothetical protein C823_005417 [Eubacterium plexicaudatum ASF492]
MPKKNYQVFLTDDDIVVLNNIRKNGHSSAKQSCIQNILLNTNDSFSEKIKATGNCPKYLACFSLLPVWMKNLSNCLAKSVNGSA